MDTINVRQSFKKRSSKGMMSMQCRPGPGNVYTTSGPASQHQSGGMTGGGFTVGSGGYPINSDQTMSGSTGGFTFRKRNERVDWKKIACVDVDHISRDLDFNTLQENIMNITFCSIDSELDVGSMDPHFVKLFKLAQLTIEYLLHSQDYLSGMVAAVEEKLRKGMEEHEETQTLYEKQKSELNEVRHESHKRKKMLVAQQQIMNAGVNSYHKCAFCPKAFVNHTFLQSHLQRRHTEQASQYNSMAASQPAPQQVPQSQPPLAQSQGQLSDEQKQLLEKELGEIKERLRLTESQLVEERNSRNATAAKERQEAAKLDKHSRQEMEEWKEKQLETQKHELDKIRDMFMRELKEMNEKYNSATSALDALQRKGRSNLGAMEDEHEEERRQLRQQREDVAELKETLEAQVADVQASMSAKFEQQENRWKEKINETNKNHRQEIKRLSRNQERLLKEQERQHMEEMSQKVVTPVAAVRSSARKTDVVMPMSVTQDERPMSPREDEDDELSDEEESSEFGDSTLARTGMFNGTGTLSLGTGTLKSMSVRLLDQLKKDPNLLRVMKEELTGVLDDNLEKRGIPPTASGISNSVLNDKLHVLKNERQQRAKKFSNLYDIRQQYIKQIDDVSREQLKKQKRETASATASSSTASRSAHANQLHLSPKRLPARPVSPTRPVSPQRPPNRSAPLPAPRAISPQGKLMSTMSTMSSTGTYATTTGSQCTWGTSTVDSNQWNSDEDSDDQGTTHNDVDGRKTPSPRKAPAATNLSPRTETEDSDWDDGSELQEMAPRESAPRAVSYSPQPRGANVARLTEQIASQLGGRGKKPAGGVETVQMIESRPGKKRDDSWDDDDDDDFSVSSLDGSLTRSAPPSRNASFNRKAATPSDVSTGTSVWGSSKASRSSFTSGTM